MSRPKGTKEPTLHELWEANKETLEEADYTEYTFTKNMESIKKQNNVRTPGAWKIFKHKTDFTDKTVIGAENMVQGIKTLDKDEYKAFRKEVVGWKNKIDYTKFDYNEAEEKYTYTNYKGETFIFTLITGPYGSQYWSWERF